MPYKTATVNTINTATPAGSISPGMPYRTSDVSTANPSGPKWSWGFQRLLNQARKAAPFRDPNAKPTTPVNTVSEPGIFERPLAGEQFYDQTKGFYTSPTATGDYYDKNKGFFSSPSISSNLFTDYQGGFFNPTFGETFAQDRVSGMASPGIGQSFIGNTLGSAGGQMGAGNQAQQAWQQFQGRRPDIAQDPGLGAYYEDAKRRAAESIGQAGAAQGAYGSSAAIDRTAEAITGLEAERANREAEYNLARLAEQRGWEGLGGQLAGQASNAQLGWTTGLGNLGLGAEGLGLNREQAAIASALGAGNLGLSRLLGGFNVSSGIDQNNLARLLGGGELAQGADLASISRIMGGQNAAGGAQRLQMDREQQQINNLLGIPSVAIPAAMQGFENLFRSDQEMLDAQYAALLGQGAEGIRGEQANREDFKNSLGSALNVYGYITGKGSGQGSGGGSQ